MDNCDIEMSLISILTVRIGKRQSVRNLLSGFGVLQWCTFSVFLAKLHHHRNHRFATQLDSQRNSAWWNSNLSNLGRQHWWCIPTLASLTQRWLVCGKDTETTRLKEQGTLLLARRYYVCNAEQRKDWKKYTRCGPFQGNTGAMSIASRRN